MLRFVLGPEYQVYPDIKRKLPGRGVWVTCNKGLLEKAIKGHVFSKSFKRQVDASFDLVDLVENQLIEEITGLLSLARKAGVLIAGNTKVETQVKAGTIAIILEAMDKDGDGKRKISRLIDQSNTPPVSYPLFTSDELDVAWGGVNTAHVALEYSGITNKTGQAIERLMLFRNHQ